MNIKIKRFDKSLPLPSKHTEGAAAFDLAAREEVTIGPRSIGYVPLNIALETPPGHFLLVAALCLFLFDMITGRRTGI